MLASGVAYFPAASAGEQEYCPLWEEVAICILDLWPEKPNQKQTGDVICSSGSDGEVPGVRVRASLPRRADLGNISSWLAEGCFSRAFRISDTGVSCLVVQLELWQSGESNC